MATGLVRQHPSVDGCKLAGCKKKIIPEDVAKGIADRYTILLKGTNAYIRFLNLNELEKSNHKNK